MIILKLDLQDGQGLVSVVVAGIVEAERLRRFVANAEALFADDEPAEVAL